MPHCLALKTSQTLAREREVVVKVVATSVEWLWLTWQAT
jgi:hypothetical protein